MRWRLYGPVLSLLALAATVGLTPAAPPAELPSETKTTVVRTDVKSGDVIQVPAGGYADLTFAIPEGAQALQRVRGTVTQSSKGLPAGRLIFAGQGTVAVETTIIDWKKQTVDSLDFTVIFGPPPPPPPVPPGPGPQPPTPPTPPVPPGPVAKVAKFVVVEDTSKPGAWRGDVLGSPKVASFYKAQGLKHRLIDVNADGDDASAVYYRKAAAGKTLPWLWLLDDAGQPVKDLACPTDPDKFIQAFDLHAGARKLGAILAKPKLKWAKFGESPAVPLIPRANWKPVDLGTFLPPVHDQDGRGQCASSSACTVWEACRNQAGLPYVYASAGDLYSRVNGGSDDGSLLEDNMAELLKNGVAPASLVPYVWDGRSHNDSATVAARKPNRVVEVYLCDSFDAMGSALQQGFVLQEGLAWYDNFDVDSDGWLPARGRGGVGGHALCGYGLASRNGVWGIKTRNSWGTSWGNSRDGSLGAGNCVIPESLFDGQIGGFWAVRAVYQSGSDFPVPKTSRAEPKRDFLKVNPFERELVLAP